MMTKKLYDVGNRDIMNLPTYADHVSAMTGEKLHAKSDIAAELAYRDARIAELENKNEQLSSFIRAITIEDLHKIADKSGLRFDIELIKKKTPEL